LQKSSAGWQKVPQVCKKFRKFAKSSANLQKFRQIYKNVPQICKKFWKFAKSSAMLQKKFRKSKKNEIFKKKILKKFQKYFENFQKLYPDMAFFNTTES